MITTDRLTLRAPDVTDAAAVTAALQDIDVVRWLTSLPYPFRLSDAQDFIAHDHGGKVFFIEDESVVCGCISLTDGLGYWLAQDRWGRGYMSEAARAVVHHHFATSSSDLQSGHLMGNAASRSILLRLGFADDFVRVCDIPALGTKMDVQKMRLTRTAWKANT